MTMSSRLDDIKARHQGDGDSCTHCMVLESWGHWSSDCVNEDWPCDAVYLLAEVERLRTALDGLVRAVSNPTNSMTTRTGDPQAAIEAARAALKGDET